MSSAAGLDVLAAAERVADINQALAVVLEKLYWAVEHTHGP